MHIVMFSMTPLFPDKSMGGAQKQLKKVALHLADIGHAVTILCTRHSDNPHDFRWHERVQIIPIYRFKQPFPEPYATPTFNIANAIQDTAAYLATADVFYSHDGGLIFPYVYQDTPTVISLRSILFSETLQSGYLFQGASLIVPSTHTANVWRETAGRFFPDFSDRIRVIHNGLDFDTYRPTTPARVRDQIPVDPDQHRIMLYPHRPEAAKGIQQTVRVADKLVNQHGFDHLRVLVPRWLETGMSPDVRQFYDRLTQDIDKRGLSEVFVFHEWISDDLMPEYLSLGDVTVALGNYVETFGNVPYESLACGTPVIASRVGTYREMLPPEHVALVDYGDINAATDHAVRILRADTGVSQATLTWLHDNFDQAEMVAAYADVILNAPQQTPLSYQYTPLTDATRFKLASWCYLSEQGVYNDFLGFHCVNEELLTLVRHAETFTFADMGAENLMAWVREGYLVPVM
jgi:glycosyltransferase involved in cell wall biosynthesis